MKKRKDATKAKDGWLGDEIDYVAEPDIVTLEHGLTLRHAAERLAATHEGNLAFVHDGGPPGWFERVGNRWQRIDLAEVETLARDAALAIDAAPPNLSEIQRRHAAFVAAIEHHGTIVEVERLARFEPALSMLAIDLEGSGVLDHEALLAA